MTPHRPTAVVSVIVGIALACATTTGVTAENAHPTIAAKDAANYVGQQATVCGVVASAKYATSTKGQPTFLNLDEPYPSQVFTVLIWGSNRNSFGAPESKFMHKNICVTGIVEAYKGKPEIVANRTDQIEVRP